jgi:hypothetical protein
MSSEQSFTPPTTPTMLADQHLSSSSPPTRKCVQYDVTCLNMVSVENIILPYVKFIICTVIGLSVQRSGFESWLVCVGLAQDKEALLQFFLRVFWFSAVSVISLTFIIWDLNPVRRVSVMEFLRTDFLKKKIVSYELRKINYWNKHHCVGNKSHVFQHVLQCSKRV